MDAPIRSVKRVRDPICTVEGCGKRHEARGLCGMHVHRANRGQDMTAPPKGSVKTCGVGGCGRSRDIVKGLCRTHYARKQRLGTAGPAEIRERYRSVATNCTVRNCDRKVYQRDVCRNHWYWHKTYSIPVEDIPGIEDRGCEICGAMDNLHIDHDHSCCPLAANPTCGKCNRGVLCANCNRALGMMKDKPERLEKAAAYLRRTSLRLDTVEETV